MDISLGEADSADWTLPVPVCCCVVDAFLAEDVGTGLEHYLSLAISTASAHYLGFVLLHLSPQHLKLRFCIQL